jgi:hypothetical protein
MKAIAGVFDKRRDAEQAVERVRHAGVPNENIVVLRAESDIPQVPTSDTEQPGMGKAMGGVIGAAAGVAGGFHLGAISAAAIPGVGPVIAAGLLGASVLGLAGTGFGVSTGGAIENAMSRGLPADEIFVYEDALRQGRIVVIVFAKDEKNAESVRSIMQKLGAESIDAARKQWWIGLRGAEKEHYSKQGRDFETEEHFYRMGFEAALNAKTRCKEYDQVISEMDSKLEELRDQYPDAQLEDPFRRGYERGRDYYQSLCNRDAKAGVGSSRAH